MFYVPPHVVLPVGSHETEEVYVVLEGQGTGTIGGQTVALEKGLFVHLPSWCEHGLENTGDEPLVILICTAPPNP
jgi:mannose-6-phosphate isomerase-like protein (cupin superfamily)